MLKNLKCRQHTQASNLLIRQTTINTKQIDYEQITIVTNVSRTLQFKYTANLWHKIKACILRLWIRNIFITNKRTLGSTMRIKRMYI
jgi:hypothetical protein